MPWWGWIAVGTLLLVAEMSFVDLEFYLVFLGAAALVVGLADLAGLHLVPWAQWILFALLAVGSLALFRGRVHALMRPPPTGDIPEGVSGEWAVAREPIAPGARGTVVLRGSTWTGENEGSSTIEAGARCRVERADGLTLRLRPEA